MIDQIFADIMKEARERPGKDLIRKIAAVSMEISQRMMATLDQLREEERRREKNEK